MAYFVGAYEYFDNKFLYDHQDLQKPKIKEYPVGSLLHFLKTNFSLWYLIMEKAGRLNFFDSVGTYTLFVPLSSSEEIRNMILSYDRQSALHTFNTHTLKGFYDKEVINTSQFQYLNTLIDGKPIFYNTYDNIGMINRQHQVLQYNLVFDNVIVHIISDYI